MRRTIAVMGVLALLLVGLVAVPALADAPMDASGNWVYKAGMPEVRVAGQNVHTSNTDEGTWTGTFEGTSVEDFVVALHQVDETFPFACLHPKGKCHGTYQGLMTFDGKVDGKAGTLVIKTNGSGPWPPLDNWSGSWVILSGTGELSNLRGQGSWWGPLGSLEYDGKIHFSG